jgi:hypothetical protein
MANDLYPDKLIYFDDAPNTPYAWKTVGGLFGLWPADWKDLPPIDVSGYQLKKGTREQRSLFDMGVYGD